MKTYKGFKFFVINDPYKIIYTITFDNGKFIKIVMNGNYSFPYDVDRSIFLNDLKDGTIKEYICPKQMLRERLKNVL